MATVEAIQRLLERLSEIPLRLARVTDRQGSELLNTGSTHEGWSVAEVFAHMRASDDVVAYRAYAILVRDNPPLPAFDERRWAEVVDYVHADFQASLALYTQRRSELVHMLNSVPLAAWQRTGVHEVRGTVSLLDVVNMLLEHEEEHCAQIEALYKR